MELSEVMRTTHSARRFTDEPVDDATVRTILDDARFAPSGGNRQGWTVVVVREQATRDALVDVVRPGMQRYLAEMAAGEVPWNTVTPSAVSAEDVAAVDLTDDAVRDLTDAPVLLVVFVDLAVVASTDRDLDRVGVISGASIYPFVWNILLAARQQGLGGTMTTFAGPREPELQRLLGVPSRLAFAAMIPMGRPVTQPTTLSRRPVDAFAFRERYGGEPLGGGAGDS